MDPTDLFRTFRRALRSCQLYPQGSQVRDQAAEQLCSRVTSYLQDHEDGISFSFVEEGAYVDGQFVKPESDEETVPLTRQLFELGVRELRFLPGVSPVEVLRLLDVLSRARQGLLNPVDEDLSILLWESDLSHIGYLLYEEELFTEEEIAESEEAEESADTENPLCDYVDHDVTVGGEEPTVAITALTESERLNILAGYRQENAEEVPYKYGRLLTELVRLEGDAEELSKTQSTLLEYLDALVATDRYEVLWRLRGCFEDGDGDTENARHALRSIRTWYLEPAIYLRATQLRCEHSGDRAAAIQFLSAIPMPALPDLVSLMVDERAEPAPEVLDQIRSQIRNDPAAQRICLKDPRSEVRRLALEEAQDVDDEAAREIRLILKDPDPELRVRAAQALSRAPSREAVDALAEALEDPGEAIRIAAAKALSCRGGARALELLLRVIVAKEFAKKGPKEKREFFQSAGQAAPEEVLPVLARLAEQRGFWPSKERSERAEAALEAMGRLGPHARDFLTARWGRKRPDLLKRFDVFWQSHESLQESRQEAA